MRAGSVPSAGDASAPRLGLADGKSAAPPLAKSEPSRLELLRQVDLALTQRESPRVALSRALHLLLPSVCQQGLLSIDELDGRT